MPGLDAAVLGDTGDLRGFRDLEPFGPLVLWTIVGCTAWALLVGGDRSSGRSTVLARLAVPARQARPRAARVGRVER